MWTKEDERNLTELQQRKAELLKRKQERLIEEVLDCFYYQGIKDHELAEELIGHQALILEILKEDTEV